MLTILLRTSLTLLILMATMAPAAAREGDTLEPISIDAPGLLTWPENLLNEENDARLINQRINEARNSGVPLAVRIVDLTLDDRDIPFQVRQYAKDDFSQPLSPDRQREIAESWARSEAVETSAGANDGFLLLVLVPEDRTQTQAIWWIGPNALPLNGLTQENILATHAVMNQQFELGNMPNGVFMGISEFSYNIQFGTPDRLGRTNLESALHTATIPMAIGTALAGLSIPILVVWLSRRNNNAEVRDRQLTPWEAAALQLGRARAEIPAAMLLDAVHRGEIAPATGGGIQLLPGESNAAVDVLRPFADDNEVIPISAMYEIEAISQPVRAEIEHSLASIGAMTPDAEADRTTMLVAMGVASFLAALSTVPSVMSMSRPGVAAIAIAGVCIASGWWWLAYRRYTSPGGEQLLGSWLESTTEDERSAFDTVVHQHLLTSQVGGPDVNPQTQLIRQFRGLGSN